MNSVIPTCLLSGLAGLILLHIAELALLGKITGLFQALLLLGSLVLQCADNTAMLVHHEIRLAEVSTGLIDRSMVNLLAGANQILVGLSLNMVGSVF